MRTIRTPKHRKLFLEALAEGLSVTGALRRARISKVAAYDWRREDEQFAAEWEEALDAGTDLMEDEARRRAVEGTLKPVYQGGQLVGEVREYSDTLLIFTLKARRPEKFRDNHKVDLTGDVTHRLDGAKDALDRKLAGLAASVSTPSVPGGSD